MICVLDLSPSVYISVPGPATSVCFFVGHSLSQKQRPNQRIFRSQNMSLHFFFPLCYFNFTDHRRIIILALQRRVRRYVTGWRWMALRLCLNGIRRTHHHGREHEILFLSLDITKIYDRMFLLSLLLFLSLGYGSSTCKITHVLGEDKSCLFTPLDRQEVWHIFKNTL